MGPIPPEHQHLARFICRRVRQGQFKFGHVRGRAIRKHWEFGEPYRVSLQRLGSDGALDPKAYRKVFILRAPDRVLHKLVSNALMEAVDGSLSDGCCGYRPRRGRPEAVRQVRTLASKEGPLFAVRYDIGEFNETVRHEILDEAVAEHISSWPLADRGIVEGTLKALHECGAEAGYDPGCGLLAGSPLGGVLTNIYLAPLDQMLDDQAISFVRSGDDVVAFADSKAGGECILKMIDGFVQENLGQARNEEKTGVHEVGACDLSPARRPCQVEQERGLREYISPEKNPLPEGGFEFVGFFFDRGGMRIREETFLKMARGVRRFTQRYKRGQLLSGDDEAVKWVTLEEIVERIARINARLGYRRRDTEGGPRETEWEFAGHGWVDCQARCGVTQEMVEQFRALDRFLFARMRTLSNPCLTPEGCQAVSAEDLRRMGMRTFIRALKDYRRSRT